MSTHILNALWKKSCAMSCCQFQGSYNLLGWESMKYVHVTDWNTRQQERGAGSAIMP